jgi:hypothetical protein
LIYNNELFPFEKNGLNYCVICRVELDSSRENIVVLPECDSIVHELCIKMYFSGRRKKIYYPTCDNKHSFILRNIVNNTESDIRLFDSINLTNIIELYTTNDIDLESICTPFTKKLRKN